jgi:hypothetical protein
MKVKILKSWENFPIKKGDIYDIAEYDEYKITWYDNNGQVFGVVGSICREWVEVLNG